MMKGELKEHIRVKLNGREVTAYTGETILDVAVREKTHIPTLCHDPRIKPFASCFLCVVHVEGMKGLQPSCSTPVGNGMVITTDNDTIKEARRSALNLLLSNHYADCLGPCKLSCPAGVDVQGYISLIEKGLYSEAVRLIKETNPLPAICGRVCVRPCELVCRRTLLEEGKGVGIDYLKRYAADMDLAASEPYAPVPEPGTGRSVAIIGAGPAGLSAAWWLSLKGHTCHIYEAAPLPGGWLRYGIPEYRLPNDILDREVTSITDLGVKIFCNTRLGRDISFRQINESYDAMILSPGSQLGTRLGCEGDDADGVMPGIDFLREMELTGVRPDLSGKNVIVVGGGNTAMDCCRSAVRCRADSVKVVYRRSEKEMPANRSEIEESMTEGVEYLFLTNPVKVIKDDHGSIKQLRVIRMELGEPDDSGRRKPVPVPGSEYLIEADLVLAAIGQKTDLSFIEDINRNTSLGELKRNRWGDIETDPETLQTGVRNIFAAGDAVTGPDTIIGAIAQARKASLSCHQYLSGLPIVPEPKVFISRRDNFRPPEKADLPQRYSHQPRQEMPLLAPASRMNFKEVELGYTGEMVVREEASRCLECGCVAYPYCDLQRYSTEYGAGQKQFSGEFRSIPPDDNHRLITFDHNKCILCGRCVRICHELAGADALGFIGRGFSTVIGPGPGLALKDTYCSSCGLCISTCPTGAITENTNFKPGPVETDSFVTTDFIGSEGATMRLHHRKGFFTAAEGSKGYANPDASIGRETRFSYRLVNLPRLTQPLIKENGKFRETSFSEVFSYITKKLKDAKKGENAFFAGARLTNEEMFLIRKLASEGSAAGIASSFSYLGSDVGLLNMSGVGMTHDIAANADDYFVFCTDLFERHQLTGFKLFKRISDGDSRMVYVASGENVRMERKATATVRPSSCYDFVRALNSYIIRNNLYNTTFVAKKCKGFESYASDLLKSDYETLLKKSGVTIDVISAFAERFKDSRKAVVVIGEEETDPATEAEIENMVLLMHQEGKEGPGIINLRMSCNSQGLVAAGMAGNADASVMKAVKNMFIFGEDPAGLAKDRAWAEGLLRQVDFMVVQDFQMTATAGMADVVLPSTFSFETGGSFTSSTGYTSIIKRELRGPVSLSGLEQIAALLKEAGVDQKPDPVIIHEEMKTSYKKAGGHSPRFIITVDNGFEPLFRHGCNALASAFYERVVAME